MALSPIPFSFGSQLLRRSYHHETVCKLANVKRHGWTRTYEAKIWTRSVSFLRGVSSFRNTFSATPRSLSSSNSRYFCCRNKNLSQVMSAPSDKGSPTCVEPFGLPNDCLSFRHDEGLLVVLPFPFPFPNETPPSLSAESVPNKSVSASSHSPSYTACRKAATLGISS